MTNQDQTLSLRDMKSDRFLAKQGMYLTKSDDTDESLEDMWQRLIHTTQAEIEHGAYIDLLLYRENKPMEKEGKFQITYYHMFLLGIYTSLVEIIGEGPSQEKFVRQIKEWLIQNKTEIEWILWCAYQEETYLFMTAEEVWYDTHIELNRKRFLQVFNDKPVLQISLHTIWENIMPNKTENQRVKLFELNDKFHLLFKEIKANENELGISVTAVIKEGAWVGVNIRKRTTHEENDNPKLLTEKIYYGEIKQKVVAGKVMQNEYIQSIRFDKDPYLNIQ